MSKEVEEFINRVRAIYNYWDLKVMVLVSMGLQIMLMFLGGRRKFTSKLWVRSIVWSAYISADSIAIIALGILSSKVGQIDEDPDTIDNKTRLLALWSPCLLLLLGGPDSITAYALEDNELWLRHLIGFVVQTIAAAYIYFLAWSVSYLSLMSILMLVAALIKCGERVWVLWQASRDKLKQSVLAAKADYKEEKVQQVLSSLADPSMVSDAEELVMAYRYFAIFKRLFVDLILSSDDRAAIKSEVTRLNWKNAFNIVEIELGFMYDLLHTKAIVLFTHRGLYRRITTCAISCTVLALFAFTHRPHYPGLDLAATFLLLSAIIFMEIYSVIMLMASDWTRVVWLLSKNNNKSWVSFVQKHLRQPRWSNCVGQLSLFSFSIKAKPLPCYRALKLLSLHNMVAKLYYTRQKKTPDYIKQQMLSDRGINYQHYKEHFAKHNHLLVQVLGDHHVDGKRYPKLYDWANTFTVEQAILVLHIATELCYYWDKHQHLPQDMLDVEPRKSAKLLSRYMYYLMERYPFLLPKGIGQIRLRDTLAEALKFFQERGLFTDDQNTEDAGQGYSSWLLICFSKSSRNKSDPKTTKQKRQDLRKLAHNMLLQVNTDVPPERVKGGQSQSVLFTACILAKELNSCGVDDHSNKWLLIMRSWLVLMYSAAYKCKGDIHVRQLRRGGELLSHVWMLIAHFGI